MTKVLLPHQCELLHLVYTKEDCCLCKSNERIRELEQKLEKYVKQERLQKEWDRREEKRRTEGRNVQASCGHWVRGGEEIQVEYKDWDMGVECMVSACWCGKCVAKEKKEKNFKGFKVVKRQ